MAPESMPMIPPGAGKKPAALGWHSVGRRVCQP